MIGPWYERSLAGLGPVEIEDLAGRRRPLDVAAWMAPRPGDESLQYRFHGPTHDVGTGTGRLSR